MLSRARVRFRIGVDYRLAFPHLGRRDRTVFRDHVNAGNRPHARGAKIAVDDLTIVLEIDLIEQRPLYAKILADRGCNTVKQFGRARHSADKVTDLFLQGEPLLGALSFCDIRKDDDQTNDLVVLLKW